MAFLPRNLWVQVELTWFSAAIAKKKTFVSLLCRVMSRRRAAGKDGLVCACAVGQDSPPAGEFGAAHPFLLPAG